MVEILSGTTAARSVAQAVPTLRNPASNSDSSTVQQTAGSEFYLSPVLRFDSQALAVIFEVRDSRSGEVTVQFPAERVVRELQKTASLGVEAPAVREQSNAEPAEPVEPSGTAESQPTSTPDPEVDVLV